MNILVCFKVLPDFDKVLPDDWTSFSWDSDLFYVKKIFNVFDESALEIALSLCEKQNQKESGTASCTALTVAHSLPASYKKNLYAVGFDRLVLLKSEHTEFVPGQIASILHKFIKENHFDLILTGIQSGYADTGLVPPLLASKLALPLISNAESLDFEDGQLSVVHQGDFGKMQTKAPLPALVSVGNSPLALRAATLRQQLSAGKKEVEEHVVGTEDFVFSEPVLFTQEHEKNCLFFEEKDKKVSARRLFESLWGGEK